jgi:hypothetical protein
MTGETPGLPRFAGSARRFRVVCSHIFFAVDRCLDEQTEPAAALFPQMQGATILFAGEKRPIAVEAGILDRR